MQLTSVNVGQERPMPNAKASGTTGIYKLPVEGPVEITYGGLAGDAICDLKHHGGADQAVYIYSTPDYAWWAGELGHKLAPGTFGENLTITELESDQAGDAVTLERHAGETVTVIEIFRDFYKPDLTEATLRRHLAAPISIRDRVEKERRLAELLA